MRNPSANSRVPKRADEGIGSYDDLEGFVKAEVQTSEVFAVCRR